jgi:type II secretory pathway component GspD/PulD (secretin)
MRFRFSIRDLLLLTVIVALAIGWWLDHRKLTKGNESGFCVYYLRYADVTFVCGSLQKLFAGDSDVMLAFDSRNNAIIVRGSARRQNDVDMLLKQFDASPTTSSVQPAGQ